MFDGISIMLVSKKNFYYAPTKAWYLILPKIRCYSHWNGYGYGNTWVKLMEVIVIIIDATDEFLWCKCDTLCTMVFGVNCLELKKNDHLKCTFNIKLMAFLTHGFLVSCIRRDSTKYSAKATAKLKYENANEGIYWVWWQTAKNMSSKSKIRRKVKDFEQEKKRTKWMA